MATAATQPRRLNSVYIAAVYPLLEPGVYRGLGQRLREHCARETASLAENRQHQWHELRRMLEHAYDSTPFYRRRFDQAGLRPSQVRSAADFRKIPFLSRDDLRTYSDDLWSRKYVKEALLPAATGGTTDTPTPLLRAPEAMPKKAAVHLRFNEWAGMRPGDKVFYLWGARVDFAQKPSWRWRLYDRYVMRRVWAPTSLFNPDVLESYRLQLNQFRPHVMYGYPTPIALFCEHLRETGRPFHRPTTVICTAEPLLSTQRSLIEETLGCAVFEQYGSREFGMIAAECEFHQGLHLNPAAAYVEFIPIENAEVDGLHEIVVTDLLNDGMPLIRYRINDCTQLGSEQCPCGRGYPLMRQVVGRTMDNFILRNGDLVPGISLQNRVIKVCPGMKKIQIVQETIDRFRLRYVRGVSFSEADLRALRQTLDLYFGAVLWIYEEVQDIERERSGKTRFCISHVSSSQHSLSAAPPVGAVKTVSGSVPGRA